MQVVVCVKQIPDPAGTYTLDPETHFLERPAEQVLDVALKAIPMAMGIAVTVLAILGEIDMQSGFSMLGIGLACLAVRELKQ